ncbi:hypothetical protein ACHAW5_001219 [Stephanodiscus triporus]|uniref:Uncharacterized protein n=1 Tax=Stephanodiscus triporus TaxID=2934178 RepID=A0ABD3MIK2_9STRA
MTDLIPDETVIMNNVVLPHSSSREPGARLEVSPLLGGDDPAASSSSSYRPNAEIVVRFVVPPSASTSTMADAQFVLELSGHAPGSIAPAKFTSSPPGGGIGCDGRRSHGKLSSSSSSSSSSGGEENAGEGDAIFTIDPARRWGATRRRPYPDSVAMAELEEAYIEEEREDIVDEIEAAEEDRDRGIGGTARGRSGRIGRRIRRGGGGDRGSAGSRTRGTIRSTNFQRMNKKEHDHARREHIKPLARGEHERFDKEAKEKFQAGVDEMMHDRPDSSRRWWWWCVGKDQDQGRGRAGYHGDVGTPLHPVAKMVIRSIFALALLCGLVDWYLGHRRKAAKGRRNL